MAESLAAASPAISRQAYHRRSDSFAHNFPRAWLAGEGIGPLWLPPIGDDLDAGRHLEPTLRGPGLLS
jgi:hypothetical protein